MANSSGWIVALVAFVCLFSTVCPQSRTRSKIFSAFFHMSFQTQNMSRSITAIGAPLQLFSRMMEDMTFQLCILIKYFSTYFAIKWLLLCVLDHVFCESIRYPKWTGAVRTFVRHFCVTTCMFNQISSLTESFCANLANIWLLSTVCSKVCFQTCALTERPVAFSTTEGLFFAVC